MSSATNDPHEDKKPKLEVLTKTRDSVFGRFPLLFTLMGTFGLVATLYGFERLIDKVPLFVNNPYILLTTGLGMLVLTGTLYKKL